MFKRALWLTFCETDERYIDLFRVGYALVLLSGVALTVYSVLNGQEFDVVAFGTGLGAILFGGGVGTGLRSRFEDGHGYQAQKSFEYRTSSPFNANAPDSVNTDSNASSPWYTSDDDLPPSRFSE